MIRKLFGVLLASLCVSPTACGAPLPEVESPPSKRAKQLRVLVAAGAPGREFQNLVGLLGQELKTKRADVRVYLQPAGKGKGGVVWSGLPEARSLKAFPAKLSKERANKPDDLASYDVVVAIDLGWQRLSKAQLDHVQAWVKRGGGLVVVAGPINTPHLAGTKGRLKPVRDLLPVVPGDPRSDKYDTRVPWRLSFPEGKRQPFFLKLDPDRKGALAGWEDFFRGERKGKLKKSEPPENGFYSCYPVQSVKSGAFVLASFPNPKARLKDGTARPFLVRWRMKTGRVLYLGSDTLWRVARYRKSFYDRLWLGMLADIGRGSGT
jgi:hypothetical protein